MPPPLKTIRARMRGQAAVKGHRALISSRPANDSYLTKALGKCTTHPRTKSAVTSNHQTTQVDDLQQQLHKSCYSYQQVKTTNLDQRIHAQLNLSSATSSVCFPLGFFLDFPSRTQTHKWHRVQFMPSLHPLAFAKYLHGCAHPCG